MYFEKPTDEDAPTLRSKSRRQSFIASNVPEEADLRVLGKYFRFMNREEQCAELIRTFEALDKNRGDAGYEVAKRKICIPTCTGTPGIGKTRFARIAIIHLARIETGIDDPTWEMLYGCLSQVAKKVWGEGFCQEQVDFLRQLLAATQHNRNLRLDLSIIATHLDILATHQKQGIGEDADSVLAAALISEWAKYRTPDNKTTEAGLLNRDVVSQLRTDSKSSGIKLRVKDAVDFILRDGQSSAPASPEGATTNGDPPVLLINLDEVQSNFNLLRHALILLGEQLVGANKRVFVTVTGMSSTSLADVMDKSNAHPKGIFLPLLQEHHMQDIIQAMFPHVKCVERALRRALWWVGGVPRLLEYFLAEAAARLSANNFHSLGEELPKCTETKCMDIVRNTVARMFPTLYAKPNAEVPNEVLDALFSLAVGEFPVDLGTRVHPRWTLAEAQSQSLIYLESISSGSKTIQVVRMPPLLLHLCHGRTDNWVSIAPLKKPSTIMSPKENESFGIGLILHKIRAASIAGLRKINLKQLGLNLRNEETDFDISPVPQHISIRLTGRQIKEDNFKLFLAGVTKNPDEVTAYVNADGSKFADVIVVFYSFTMFVQEKRSIVARKQKLDGQTISLMPQFGKLNGVNMEFRKIRKVFDPNKDVFVYITDHRAREDKQILDKKCTRCVIVDEKSHATAFGKIGAMLRCFHSNDTEIEA